MKNFRKNSCRACVKVFCCIKCRIKHESTVHKIYENCDICVYGAAFLNKPNSALINHIESCHWPLECRYCKKRFKTLDEILLNYKCAMMQPQKEAPKVSKTVATPLRTSNKPNCNSPPVTPYINEQVGGKQFLHIQNTQGATSTPLHSNDIKYSAKIPPPIMTPVDPKSEPNLDFNSEDRPKSSEQKRKSVTFSTPVMDLSNALKVKQLRLKVKPELPNFEGRISELSSSENIEKRKSLESNYYSFHETIFEQELSDSSKEKSAENEEKPAKTSDNIIAEGTMWESAVGEIAEELNKSIKKELESNNEVEVKITVVTEEITENPVETLEPIKNDTVNAETTKNTNVETVENIKQETQKELQKPKQVFNDTYDIIIKRSANSTEKSFTNETPQTTEGEKVEKSFDDTQISEIKNNSESAVICDGKATSSKVWSSVTSLFTWAASSIKSESDSIDITHEVRKDSTNSEIQENPEANTSKRSLPLEECSTDEPAAKRSKYYWDIKCRRPIRPLGTIVYLRTSYNPVKVDKSTQTE